jgi:hypothetical protein
VELILFISVSFGEPAACINICAIFFLRMINPRIFGIVFIVVAAASIGLVIIGFQSTMASKEMEINGGAGGFADVEEDVGAGNATTTMMTNQTTNGNMTGVEFLSIQSAQSGSISQINETAYSLELNNVANDTIQFSAIDTCLSTGIKSRLFGFY